MVDIRKGLTKKHASSQKLISFFQNYDFLNGYFYIGYPIIYAGGESTTIDALWISQEYGVIVFDIVEGTEYSDRYENQEELYSKVHSLLMQNTELVKNRNLDVNLDIITFAPAWSAFTTGGIKFKHANTIEDLLALIQNLPTWESSVHFKKVLSVVQSITKLRSNVKRTNVKKGDSRGAKLKKLEDTIANLDNEQERAVIDYYEGVQRIRGLAGSGKTVVLALKAAYLHAQNPDWKIAVTFHTRALKNQFRELIERFCVEKRGAMPDWDNLKIIHAWGSPKVEGIYYDFCIDNNIEYHNFSNAQYYKQTSASIKPEFEAICEKALKEVSPSNIKEKYDVILIDEAQDLSEAFLKICYSILHTPKNLIYAYDELQKLNDGFSLGNPASIFGIPEDHFNDTILYKCYRNSRPVLVTAHALGFGVYRNIPEPNKLVQFFDQPKLWQDVGYEIKSGHLRPGEKVELTRSNESSPSYLESYLDNNIEDILVFKPFTSVTEQSNWVAKSIKENLKNDELLHKDIVVINCRTLTTEKDVSRIRGLLYDDNILTHIAGATNADAFYETNSVAFTGIYRAKGNEVPMVYIINADECFTGRELIKKRNTLFTAITRSKAWVRVCGTGSHMNGIIREYEEVKKRNFELHFEYPDLETIQKLNVINRDMSADEKKILSKDTEALSSIKSIVARIKSGKGHLEDYPEDLQEILKLLI